MNAAYDKRETRIRCVREALERVARHVCCDKQTGRAWLFVAERATDDELHALGLMLKHIV